MRYYSLGDVPPVGPGMVYCGDGLSVRADLPCPAPAPLPTPQQQIAINQAQVEYAARVLRCQAYQRKEYAVDVAAAIVAALVFPGAWALLALPIAVIVEAYYPKSEDCDYGW